MTLKPFSTLAAVAIASLLAVMPFEPATAWSTSGSGSMSGPHCKTGGSSVNINKNISIYKPVTINNNVSIYKPVTINKSIDIQKNITIEKNITINKGGSATATATASAAAQAFAGSRAGAFANAGAQGNVYYGSYSEENVYYGGVGGQIGSIATTETCTMQEATVVKSIHAVCLTPDGHEFPASHMLASTFIDSSYEGEIARCIPGSHLKIVIGDVVQSDQGMAGTYGRGAVLMCGEHEALHHYKNGMLKCEPAVPVKDCTERTNLRKYGSGDMFFTFRTMVCATAARSAQEQQRAVEVGGMTLEGGVGDAR